ncbi:hypothetical protein [Microbacterium paludicola]|uniref:hypothetical protein n=1 Tax=Microbacterium paludicola TaxID=300019 RepID=UPI000A7EBA89|nr:hypothetical protein [Microbacterium paludicola]
MTWVWKQIHWPQPFDHAEALGFVQRLAADEDRGPAVFEARAEAGIIRHLIGSEQTDLSAVRSTLRRLIPEATVTKPEEDRVLVERAGRVRIRQRNLGLSLDTDGTALRALYAALSQATGADDVLVMQVILGASVPPQVVPTKPQDPNLSLFDLALSGSHPASSEMRRGMVDKLGQYRFRATVRLGVSAASPVRRRLLVFSILAALRQLQTGSTRIDLQSERPDLVDQATIPARKPLRLTADEALCVLGWPTGKRQLPGNAAAASQAPRPAPRVQGGEGGTSVRRHKRRRSLSAGRDHHRGCPAPHAHPRPHRGREEHGAPQPNRG